MLKSPKQHQIAKFWGKLTQRRMRRDQKNIKITPETHRMLKVFAAQRGLNISDCADKIIEIAVTCSDISRDIIDAELAAIIRTE